MRKCKTWKLYWKKKKKKKKKEICTEKENLLILHSQDIMKNTFFLANRKEKCV